MKKALVRTVSAIALAALLGAMAPAARADGAVNLNTASEAQLEALPGIGPSKAKAIIEYRKAHPFQTVDEVKNVRGIGDSLYDSLKDKMTVGAATASK
jgi:competence protein ComEA